MGEKSSQIEQHIQDQRNELGEHIGELKEKVQSAMDWRTQFEERPLTMLGLAFSGGVLLSALAPRPRSRSSSRSSHDFEGNSRASKSFDSDPKSEPILSRTSSSASKTLSKASDTLENVKGALIGVAATKVASYLEEIIPGFVDEYKKSESRKGSAGSTRSFDDSPGWSPER